MKYLHVALMLTTAILLVSCGGGEEGTSTTPTPMQDISAGARKPLEESIRAIVKAKEALASIPRPRRDPLIASLDQAQAAIQEIGLQQALISQQLDVIAKEGASLQEEKKKLEAEKEKLKGEKNELEKRETLWSTGFVAALIAAVVSVVSGVLRLPLMRLDMKLKSIEIKEKEFLLQEKIRARSEIT